MTTDRARVELSRVVKHAFRLALVLGIAAAAVLLRGRVRLENELQLARDELSGNRAVVRQLQEQNELKHREAERVAELVRQELVRREQIHLAMAEILARARALQDERDRLTSLEHKVREALNRVDSHYNRMRSATGVQ